MPRPEDPNAPTLAPQSGWHAAHIGFDHDDFVLDGLPVWSLPWREEAIDPVMLAHPAYPAQLHGYRVYDIDDGAHATRFAAAELSNGVWGFYRWIAPADAASGVSADGSLRYEHDLGPYEGGRYDAVSPCARVNDARTGETLFDGTAWASSRVVQQADGSMLLSLEHRERQTIFRIDPEAGTFRDLATGGEARSLAGLSAAAGLALAECNDRANDYLSRRVAPDGSFTVDLAAVEWSNSHWVRSPRVTEIATGRVLLDLWGTDWDGAVSFPRAKTVRLDLRRYHHGGEAAAEIDLADDRYILFEKAGATGGPVTELRPALERAACEAAERAGFRPIIVNRRPTARNWLVALLILVGALALIAASTMITLYVRGEPPPQKLDTVPPMLRAS